MAKTANFKDILSRVEKLERTIKAKDDEITKLRDAVRDADKYITDELHKRDAVITDLYAKIEDLSTKTIQAENEELSSVTNETLDLNETGSIEKNKHDLLIIGDSLVHGLDTSSLNPGGDITIECVPGARPDDLVAKFRELSKTESYRRIVVHAGTNMIPKFSPEHVADKITSCLEMVREISPRSKVTFSAVLPKEGPHLLAGINLINERVFRSGLCGHFKTRYGFINHSDFFSNRGIVNGSLFKRDNLHLSDIGIKAFERSLKRLATSK